MFKNMLQNGIQSVIPGIVRTPKNTFMSDEPVQTSLIIEHTAGANKHVEHQVSILFKDSIGLTVADVRVEL